MTSRKDEAFLPLLRLLLPTPPPPNELVSCCCCRLCSIDTMFLWKESKSRNKMSSSWELRMSFSI